MGIHLALGKEVLFHLLVHKVQGQNVPARGHIGVPPSLGIKAHGLQRLRVLDLERGPCGIQGHPGASGKVHHRAPVVGVRHVRGHPRMLQAHGRQGPTTHHGLMGDTGPGQSRNPPTRIVQAEIPGQASELHLDHPVHKARGRPRRPQQSHKERRLVHGIAVARAQGPLRPLDGARVPLQTGSHCARIRRAAHSRALSLRPWPESPHSTAPWPTPANPRASAPDLARPHTRA